MILDAQLLFSAGATYGPGTLAIADAFTTTAASGNVIDLGVGPTTGVTAGPALPPSWNLSTANPSPFPTQQPMRDIGIGDDPAMKLLVEVVTAFTSAGAPTLAIALQGAPDAGTGAQGGFVTWWTSPAYTFTAPAQLGVGARLLDMDFPRPPQGAPIPRFVRLNYTVGVTTFTGGALISAIVLDRHDQVYNTSSATGVANNAILGGYPAGVIVQN